MNDVQPLDRQTAGTYAAWVKALADGTRVQIVSLLARDGRPPTVREIGAAGPGDHRRRPGRLPWRRLLRYSRVPRRRRPARGRSAGQPGLRQPGRGRRPAAG